MKKTAFVSDCLTILNRMAKKASSDSEEMSLRFAHKFISKHVQENIISYKDFFVPVFYDAEREVVYGKAINKNDPYGASVLIEGNDIANFIANFHDNIDMLEEVGLIANG